MTWYESFEVKAEDYIRHLTVPGAEEEVSGHSQSLSKRNNLGLGPSLSKRNNLGLGPNVVRWNGPGICTRHLAGKYYLAALKNIEKFRGGLVGCAVGRSSDNGIACIYYKR
eukprot:sb/3477234/